MANRQSLGKNLLLFFLTVANRPRSSRSHWFVFRVDCRLLGSYCTETRPGVSTSSLKLAPMWLCLTVPRLLVRELFCKEL